MGRIQFRKGQQRIWIESILVKTGLDVNQLAIICKVSPRTIRDWRREKYNISEDSFDRLSIKYNIPTPTYINYLPSYWYLKENARNGALKRLKLYGPPGTPQGRSKGGRITQRNRKLYPHLYTKFLNLKNFRKPDKSEKLAELIGIILGDGGITNYQLKITLNKKLEMAYINFVSNLIEEVFKTRPVKYFFNNIKGDKVGNVTVNGVKFIKILEELGLKKGNKVTNQVRVPDWITENINYSKKCVRGLMDTDGCVYFHNHFTKGVSCFNLGLTFTNSSRPLLEFVHNSLLELGFTSKIKHRSVYLYRFNEIVRYFGIIGSDNKHHKDRLKKFIDQKLRRDTQVVYGARLENV